MEADMDSKDDGVLIGSIYACIDDDRRYGTTLEVYLMETDVTVCLVSTNPVGGMDGPGGVHHDRTQVGTCPQNGTALIKLLRGLFKTVDAGTVARYGKPTKNFRWHTGVESEDPYSGRTLYTQSGFNAALAEAAMAEGYRVRADR